MAKKRKRRERWWFVEPLNDVTRTAVLSLPRDYENEIRSTVTGRHDVSVIQVSPDDLAYLLASQEQRNLRFRCLTCLEGELKLHYAHKLMSAKIRKVYRELRSLRVSRRASHLLVG